MLAHRLTHLEQLLSGQPLVLPSMLQAPEAAAAYGQALQQGVSLQMERVQTETLRAEARMGQELHGCISTSWL